MERHEVRHTGRVSVTEKLVQRTAAKNVLEVGAGDYSFEGVKKGLVQTWVTVDFAPPCDIACDLNSPKLKLPFSDGKFDLVICTEVLEHLLWPQQFLKEAFRVLTPTGKLIVSVPNITSLSYRIAWLMGRVPSCAASGNLPTELGSTAYRNNDGRFVGGHVIDFNLRKLQCLLAMCGFRGVTTRGSGIIWHRQLLPAWIVPVSLSSNIICLVEKI